jgi:uncharacterized OB-fold protein
MGDRVTNQEPGTVQRAFVPALPYLIVDPDGRHGLTGTRCKACGTVVVGGRMACAACGETTAIETVRLGTRGLIHAHTVVHRSYPGVKTPFISVVVDLDGGGTVRGTLTDVDPLAPLPSDLRVEMVFRDSGQRDKEGRSFLSYYFVPGSAS